MFKQQLLVLALPPTCLASKCRHLTTVQVFSTATKLDSSHVVFLRDFIVLEDASLMRDLRGVESAISLPRTLISSVAAVIESIRRDICAILEALVFDIDGLAIRPLVDGCAAHIGDGLNERRSSVLGLLRVALSIQLRLITPLMAALLRRNRWCRNVVGLAALCTDIRIMVTLFAVRRHRVLCQFVWRFCSHNR